MSGPRDDGWLAALERHVLDHGEVATVELLDGLAARLRERGLRTPGWSPSTYVNTIRPEQRPAYPGDLELEARLEAAIRWNAMAMVVRANRDHAGLGGHISTYAAVATLFEVALHHCIRAEDIV